MPLTRRPLLAALSALVLTGAPAAAAPVRVMTAPPGAPVTEVRVSALPSGDVVVAQSGAELRYAARAAGRWTRARALPRLFLSIARVSAVQRGDRWLLSWLGRGSAAGSRALVFADFRGARRAPRVGRIFTHRAAIDPVAVPGAHAGARAVWPVADALFEGATDPVGVWRAVAVVPGQLASSTIAVAAGPGARRLVVWSGRENGVGAEMWSSAGPADRLPGPRALYAPPAGRFVVQRAAAFRAGGGAAALLLTLADPLQLQLEAVSIDGDAAAAPRLVASGQRMPVTEPPQVASLSDGRLVAVWRRVSPPHVQLVVANERSVGGEWTAPLAISPASRRAGIPNLVISGSGRPAVSWSDGRRVRVRVLRIGARVTGGTTTVVSGSHPNCRQPASAASGARTLTVAFACEAGRNVYIASRMLPSR